MMTKEEFLESQKECAEMLGMTLDDYEIYCKNIKVPIEKESEYFVGNTDAVLKILGMAKNIKEKRKEIDE